MPIADVTDTDVAQVIRVQVNRGHAGGAHSSFRLLTAFFRWASSPMERGKSGLKRSPIHELTEKNLGLKKRTRQRMLDGHEIRAYWKVTGEIGYPYGDDHKAPARVGSQGHALERTQRAADALEAAGGAPQTGLVAAHPAVRCDGRPADGRLARPPAPAWRLCL
jgi:hypothetical protein